MVVKFISFVFRATRGPYRLKLQAITAPRKLVIVLVNSFVYGLKVQLARTSGTPLKATCKNGVTAKPPYISVTIMATVASNVIVYRSCRRRRTPWSPGDTKTFFPFFCPKW